jgi:hypothetical protein
VRARRRLSPPFLSAKPTPSNTKEFASVMAFKEVCGCEILISKIERRLELYDCSLKESGEGGQKGKLGKRMRGRRLFLSAAKLHGSENREKGNIFNCLKPNS